MTCSFSAIRPRGRICENKTWKKFRLPRWSNPWPLRYRCNERPTQLTSQPQAGRFVGSWSTHEWWIDEYECIVSFSKHRAVKLSLNLTCSVYQPCVSQTLACELSNVGGDTYLRVSQSFTVMSYDPEISSYSLLGDQATEDTQPWCDVRVFLITAPSVS